MTEDKIDAYYAYVDQAVNECISHDLVPQDLLTSRIAKRDAQTLSLVSYRVTLSTSAEYQRAEGLLVTAIFGGLKNSDRIGAFLVCFEIGDQIAFQELETRFAPYKSDNGLLVTIPSLENHIRDHELIDRRVLGKVESDGAVMVGQKYARLDPMLPPCIVHALEGTFPTAPLYLRLDPGHASAKRPPEVLLETVLVPANPRWWRDLGLYRGKETGAQYFVIAPEKASDDTEAFVEHHVRGFRKLETITQRREVNHLTMMLEELEQRRDGLLIGRCIHLDTDAPRGTTPTDAQVLHVDLAINVYAGSAVQARMTAQMNETENVDATFRTHLLRTEKIPFAALALLSFLFFKSHILRRDLFVNQFGVVADE